MTQTLIKLSRAYPAKAGVPIISSVNPEIFTLKFGTCMDTHCDDKCCRYGVDVSASMVEQILKRLGITPACFGKMIEDGEFPGGAYCRTRHDADGCVFLKRHGRGCDLHERDEDYHKLKPMVCILFPCTFDDGELHAADEVRKGALPCAGGDKSLYRITRDELLYYFGEKLVAELDTCESRQ